MIISKVQLQSAEDKFAIDHLKQLENYLSKIYLA